MTAFLRLKSKINILNNVVIEIIHLISSFVEAGCLPDCRLKQVKEIDWQTITN
jgi:hypothetical protein